ncbi:tetratricopeptide repeat protein [Flammeovirgaceae bacterium SG7u.111]|nr:tetratricopeptide repeat protein [Flammeovirgaceae bacterium SG7u.132]WPO35514.1 tetratricopeptide repeat protein [Flammeovirgaceae bacterium SG7u.111]
MSKSLKKNLSIFSFLFISFYALSQDNNVELANQYYANDELDKAVELYEKLVKKPSDRALVHRNYLEALMRLEEYKDAEKYLKKLLKDEPYDARYNIDYAMLVSAQKGEPKSNEYLDNYLEQIKKNDSQLQYAATFFIDNGKFEYAEKSFLMAQKNNVENFYDELADLYALWNKPEKMAAEYIKILEEDPSKLEYVEDMLQERLGEEEDFDKLGKILVENVQKKPDQPVFNELLIWYFLQKQEFYKAFIQARAIDKRKRLEGRKVLEIGKLALGNGAYKDASRIFQYLVDKYENKNVYFSARRLLVKSKEELVKHTFPIDLDEIRSLSNDYSNIVKELGIRPNTADAVRSMALLQGFYLNNVDTAIIILEDLVKRPGMKKYLISNAKLDLGDIYLLKGEPWEASLLYSQVEKAEKDENLGHFAKLKNAKLSYYKGEFELAKAHLDVLKMATSREIANDAMQLSLLIQDNLALDTSDVAMKAYSSVELLVFQSKYEEAIVAYENMLKEFANHSLTDEIYWELANINLKLGNFDESITSLEKILEEYRYDILADDANFLIGKIYEENMNNPEKAMEYYEAQLKDFPGSIYNVEARKRFRKLRGDSLN